MLHTAMSETTPSETNSGFWRGLKGTLLTCCGSSLMLALAIAARGDLLLILVYIIGPQGEGENEENNNSSAILNSSESGHWLNEYLAQYRLQNLHIYTGVSLMISLSTFMALVGTLHWFYYYKQREQPEKWKCQPGKFLSPENARHEQTMGCINMALGGTVSGIIATYIINGGHTSLYFNINDRSLPFLVVTTLMLFFIQDATSFYAHRTYHYPWLYKRIHKHHHRYHSPTAFSATAMHPLEFLTYQATLGSPAFWFPCYSGSFILCLMYSYYYGVIDHSGIKMDAIWPWQPSSMFHDNHHRYFHCNFGFNLKIWDWLHDTLEKPSRDYGEDIFGGKGKPKSL